MGGPGSRLVAFVTGRLPGLSEDAERGRREILWISASVWIAPIVGWVQGLADFGIASLASLAPSVVVNGIVFAALVQGKPWARKLTVILLVPTAAAHFLLASTQEASPRVIAMSLFSGVVYGAAAWMLGRSPTVRAYIESQQGTFTFPSRGPRAALPKDEP